MTDVRAVNAPTVFEEYNQDKEGYDALLAGPDNHELAMEHNQVTGNESLYKAFLIKPFAVKGSLEDITGNEGFFQFIKDAGKKFIETIKSFFKWLWSFVSGKKASIDVKKKTLEERYKKFGINTSPVAYKQNMLILYGGTNTPPADIHWVPGVISKGFSCFKPLEDYLKLVDDFCNEVIANLNATHKKPAKELKETLAKDFQNTFGFKGVGTSITLVGGLKFTLLDNCRIQKHLIKPVIKQGDTPPTFTPDKASVDQIMSGFKTFNEKGNAFDNKVFNQDAKITKNIEKVIAHFDDKTSEEDKAAYQAIKNTIHGMMSNISAISVELFNLEKAMISVLESAIASK